MRVTLTCQYCNHEFDPRGFPKHAKACSKHPGIKVLVSDWAKSESLTQMAGWHKVNPSVMRRWLEAAEVKDSEKYIIGGGNWKLVPESKLEFEHNPRDRCTRCPAFGECSKVFPLGYILCETLDTGQVRDLESCGLDVEAMIAQVREYVENGRVTDPAGA